MRQTPIMAATSPAISVALSDEKARLDVAFRSAALARMLTTIDVHQPPRARVAAWADANTSGKCLGRIAERHLWTASLCDHHRIPT
jgi:hypothetical protein